MSNQENTRILKAIKRNPRYWITQKRFDSQAIKTAEAEEYHLCVGVYTINGKYAGYYGRGSKYPRIDERAEDMAILVKKGDKENE